MKELDKKRMIARRMRENTVESGKAEPYSVEPMSDWLGKKNHVMYFFLTLFCFHGCIGQ